MIRVLFIILAVVAMGLAFVLDISWLYLVAAGMLIVAGVILTFDTRKRMRRSEVAGSRPSVAAPDAAPKDELKSLGIMEIRPAAKRRSADSTEQTSSPKTSGPGRVDTASGPSTPPNGFAPPSRSAASESTGPVQTDLGLPLGGGTESVGATAGSGPRSGGTGEPSSVQPRFAGTEAGTQPAATATGSLSAVRKRPRSARIMVEGISPTLREEVVLSTLRALRAAVDATTVALLRAEDSPLGYTVEAIISRNAFARSGGRFAASEPLTKSGQTLIPVTHRCNGSGGFDAKRLGYYHEPIAIHEVAFVPMRRQNETYLLVADTMLDDALGEPEAVRMLSEFARLIQALIGEPIPAQDGPEGESLRPRREIIAEEMNDARSVNRPLALTLVHLNRSEDLADEDRPAVELAMESRLRESAADGRVERFGELTYGILRQQDIEEIASWASGLHRSLRNEKGTLNGGVSVGVAMLAERHEGPDELRGDATAALRESYETGECVILE